MSRRSVVASLTTLLICSPVLGQESVTTRKQIDVNKVDVPPVLDGRLDDAAWQSATIVEDLHEVSPNEFDAPSRRTRIYVVYDTDALYVGARMFEDDVEDINAFVQKQDGGLSDDRFALLIDPFNNGRGGYMFELNALSVRDDALFQNTTEQNWEWDGIWQGKSSMDDEGWIAEIRIPFKTVSFDPENDTWGISFARYATRQQEHFGWTSRNRSQDPSNFGEASGFEDLSQGIGLDIVPGIALKNQRDLLTGETDDEFDPSLDVFYRISPSITASLTINTDFSGTDVDEVQVNLDRFGLFFPEQRDFFLRDTDIFEFGRIGGGDNFSDPSTIDRVDRENGRPFFSRRIGLSDSGEDVRLNYGGKLTGRIGRFDVGALAIQQDDFGSVDSTNLIVARAAMSVLGESSVGFILTDGNPTENLDNTLVGVDFRYLNTRLPNGQTLEGGAWYQQTDSQDLDGDDSAFGLSLSLPNTEFWRGGISYKELEENFNPALGFVNRVGVSDATLEVGYTHRPGGDVIRSIYVGVDAQRIERLSGGLQTQRINFRALEIDNFAGDSISLNIVDGKENVAEPFTVSDGITILPGEYSSDEVSISLDSADQRSVSGGVSAYVGDFFGGDIFSWSPYISWRPSANFDFGLSMDLNHVDLPQGSFITRVMRLRADIAFNDTWSWENFAQYDNVSDTAGLNSIVRWVPEAGREMLIVLNYGAEDFDESGSFNTALVDLTFKISHTFRF